MSALEDYERGVKEGRGQGRFSSYKPWLIVKKVKSCAIRSRTYIRRFGRLFHLMSDAEVQTLLQLDWEDNGEQAAETSRDYTEQLLLVSKRALALSPNAHQGGCPRNDASWMPFGRPLRIDNLHMSIFDDLH